MTMLQQINATTNAAGGPVFTDPAKCYLCYARNDAEHAAVAAAVIYTGATIGAITPYGSGYIFRIDATPAQAAYIHNAAAGVAV